jgi:DNA-binding XRE family transcriptional regulator
MRLVAYLKKMKNHVAMNSQSVYISRMLSRQQRNRLRATPLESGQKNKIESARKAMGLTQVELGEILGWEQNRISLLERGKYRKLPLETARTLSTFFGVPIEEIFPAIEDAQ